MPQHLAEIQTAFHPAHAGSPFRSRALRCRHRGDDGLFSPGAPLSPKGADTKRRFCVRSRRDGAQESVRGASDSRANFCVRSTESGSRARPGERSTVVSVSVSGPAGPHPPACTSLVPRLRHSVTQDDSQKYFTARVPANLPGQHRGDVTLAGPHNRFRRHPFPLSSLTKN